MAKVSLRSYNQQIGTLIDQEQLEEAVGHCNHILKTFPKHLETYQLLGKAYLEARRFKDASDVFSRLLAAVPNDFVAHVGMSMIAEETQRPDEAIWHMERAFESQPSNAAVQSELQRLYGRRDGVQPPKIRMTSGALAHVYVQGELYTQAIAEIMSAEAKDPERMDMKVLLALAYFRSGQRVEASKVASDLLAKLPYCLDANRILVEILPETSRAETAQVYQHRVNALDPYAAFAKSSIFNTSDVADAAVSLERLDWQPGDTVFADDDEWGASGVSSSIQADVTGDEEQPDWLKEGAAEDMDAEPATTSEPPAETEDNIPDFMRAAGWGASSGTEEEPTSFFDSDNSVDEPIEQAELPDWMKNIAPDQATLEAESEETDEMGDAMAEDWINDLLDSNDEEKPQDSSSSDTDFGNLGELGSEATPLPAADSAEDVPDWLNELGEEASAPPAEDSGDDVPDWLNDIGTEETTASAIDSAEDVPEWLRETGEAPATSAEETPVTTEESDDEKEEMPASEDDDDMGWLSELAESAEEEPITPTMEETRTEPSAGAVEDAAIGTLGTSSEEQDAAMNWLESLAANQGAAPEELITDPGARTEAAPEWVQKAQDVSASAPPEETPAPQEEAHTVEEELSAEKIEMAAPPAAAAAAESMEDTPAWLRDEEDIIPDVTVTPTAEDEDMGRLSDLAEDAVEEPVTPTIEEAAADTDIPTEPSAGAVEDATIGTLGTSSEEQDAALNWLESLAVNQGANPEELITDPSARPEAAPEWVQEAQDVSASAPPEETPEPQEEAPAAEDDLAWMSELGDEEVPAPAADSSDDVPEWLRDEEEVAAVADEVVVDESTADDEEEKQLAEQAQAKLAYEAPAPIPVTEEPPITPLMEAETTPATEPVQEEIPETPVSEDEMPEWLRDEEKAPAVTEQKEIVITPSAEEPSAAPIVEEESEPEPEPVQEEPPEAPMVDEETPEWVKAMEEEKTQAPEVLGAEETDDLPAWLSGMGEEEKPEPAASSDDLPDWLKEEETSTTAETPQPTKAEEWKPVEEAPAVDTKEEKPAEAPVDLPQRREVQMDTAIPRDETLMSAQTALKEGNITAALAEYGKLIKKKRLLDETIYDLKEALYDYPVDVSIWQMLGDAYMRAGQLQEAINAYTKAEELLR